MWLCGALSGAQEEAQAARYSLFLGGKSPNIIFPDADLDAAVSGALVSQFFNQGQVCCAGSRTFVHVSPLPYSCI